MGCLPAWGGVKSLKRQNVAKLQSHMVAAWPAYFFCWPGGWIRKSVELRGSEWKLFQKGYRDCLFQVLIIQKCCERPLRSRGSRTTYAQQKINPITARDFSRLFGVRFATIVMQKTIDVYCVCANNPSPVTMRRFRNRRQAAPRDAAPGGLQALNQLNGLNELKR